jgi:hypothetical protein
MDAVDLALTGHDVTTETAAYQAIEAAEESALWDEMHGCDCPVLPQEPCVHDGGPVAGDGWQVIT